MDHTIIAGVVTILVAFISLIFFIYTRKKLKDGVLLLGINDSGKTCIFYKLTNNADINSVSSINENVGSAKFSNKISKIIDVPGHEKIRNSIISKYKDNTKALVFVIDSQTILANIRDISEYLYEILADEKFNKSKTPILILCNKQDLELSKSAKVIQTRLENEISIVKQTKAGALDSIDNKSRRTGMLGNKSESFLFDQLPNRVDFNECSVKSSISCIEDWLKAL